MERYPLHIIDGHLVADIGGRWFLVDTGSHATFGEGGSLTILGREIPYPPDLLSLVTIGDINQHVHPRIQAILGADVLAESYFTFDLERRQFVISREPIHFRGTALEIEPLMGVPIVKAAVGGRPIRAVVDTGATICFLEPEDLGGLEVVGTKQDFFPTMGPFQTDVFLPTVELAGARHSLYAGILPENLRDLMTVVGARAILGTDLLNLYDIYFALPGGRIYLRPNPSDRAVRVEVPFDRSGPSARQRSWTDAELLRQILLGNPLASERFFDQYRNLIYSVLKKHCGLREDMLDDAWQHVAVKLIEDDWRRLRLWRGGGKLSTYLAAVTINLGHDFREREIDRHRRRMNGDARVEDKPARDSPGPDPERTAIFSQLSSAVSGLVALLEERCRRLIDLRFNSEMSYREISEEAGLTLSHVGVSLHRCLESLRRLVREEFPDLFDAPLRDFYRGL